MLGCQVSSHSLAESSSPAAPQFHSHAAQAWASAKLQIALCHQFSWYLWIINASYFETMNARNFNIQYLKEEKHVLFLYSTWLDNLGRTAYRSQTSVRFEERHTHSLSTRSPIQRGEKSRCRQDQVKSYSSRQQIQNGFWVPGSLGKLQWIRSTRPCPHRAHCEEIDPKQIIT